MPVCEFMMYYVYTIMFSQYLRPCIGLKHLEKNLLTTQLVNL